MTHTHKPWTVSTDRVHIQSGSYVIAAVFGANGHGQIPAETDANARLIAAAPELLAACKFARERLMLLLNADSAREADVVLADTATKECLLELEAAIDKATGGQ